MIVFRIGFTRWTTTQPISPIGASLNSWPSDTALTISTGYKEANYDLNVEQGCVFYKLFIRAFPNHFTFNSIYAHYPLTIPSENKKIMTNLERLDDYSWERPSRIAGRKNVASYDAVTTILKNGDVFSAEPWRRGLYFLMGKPGMYLNNHEQNIALI